MTYLDDTSEQGVENNLVNKTFFRKRVYFGLLLTAFVVLFHATAGNLSWYWIFKWLDNPMHVLGGIVGGYFSILFYYIYRIRKNVQTVEIAPTSKSTKWIFGAGIIGALIVGILWEVLEHLYGLSGLNLEFRFDTIKDLVNDMMGGIIAALIWEISIYKSKKDKAKG